MTVKPVRIRDPVHNLIEFGATSDPDQRQLEHTLWSVVQTSPFQRLRRVKQLGFSELVFPGATHTRFAHSLGVFHTARQLTGAIRRSVGNGHFDAARARIAMAAAMVHDVGHGMFSHAFEPVKDKLGLADAKHEMVSQRLIRESEIAEAFREQGSGFAHDVAELIGRKYPKTFYDAVVTSQFDADRLDYMQRDRMMTGIGSGAVDVEWLLHNLEVEDVRVTTDNEDVTTVQSLVVGPKAFHVAESYVLALFHLYPNVYFHKATRGAEQVLQALILRIFELVRDGHPEKTGLPKQHALIKFARKPDNLDAILALDDATLWGALPMMVESRDEAIRLRSSQLRDRHLLKCLDIWELVASELPPGRREDSVGRNARLQQINKICDQVKEYTEQQIGVLIDDYTRDPYKRFQNVETVFNQIHIKHSGGIRDMGELSVVVGSAEPFRICRAYIERGDTNTESLIRNKVRTYVPGRSNPNE
jgi:HD superfamily phosphohydrolase